jgi:hypothetical protein
VRSEDTTRRRQAFVLVVVVSLALWPGRVLAFTPDRQPVPAEDFSIPAEVVCTFPVSVHFVTNNQYSIDFFDADGNPTRTITQGNLVMEITNLDTGTSVIRNVSGPGTTTHPDEVLVATGSWFFAFAPGELVDELGHATPGSMFINHGKFVVRIGDPLHGVPHQLISQTGVQEDLCATLGESPDAEASGAGPSGCPDGEDSEAEETESQVRPQGPPDARPEGVDVPDELSQGPPGSLLFSGEVDGEFLGNPPEISPRIVRQTGVQEDPCPRLGASPDGETTEAAAGDETDIPLARLP